ncbi:MAG: MBL fold metallo-hydrolase [Lysinibacillus sp.]
MKEEICEGVYRIQIPIPYDLRSINCYIVEGDKGYTIIDTGDYTDEAKDVWRAAIGNMPVERVVITHAHADHFGLAPWFQSRYGATIVMSRLGKERLLYRKSFFKDGVFDNKMFDFMQGYGMIAEPKNGEIFNKIEAYEFLPDELFEAGEAVRIGRDFYDTILTPGHASDQFCFYLERNGCLFLGDHLLEDINPIVMPEENMLNPLALYLPTFQVLSKLNIVHALPGHGSIIPDFDARVKRLLEHYEKRFAQILSIISEQYATALDIMKKVYTNTRVEYMDSALIQTVTNLNYLESQNMVEKSKEGDVYYFYKKPVTTNRKL